MCCFIIILMFVLGVGGHEFTSLKLFYFVFGFLGAEAGGAFAMNNGQTER